MNMRNLRRFESSGTTNEVVVKEMIVSTFHVLRIYSMYRPPAYPHLDGPLLFLEIKANHKTKELLIHG